MDGNLTTLDRLSRIFLYKRYFNYPLETANVVRNLPTWVLIRAFLDYFLIRIRNRIRPIPDDNFENWTRKRFGNTVYKVFFGTYTEKAWGMNAQADLGRLGGAADLAPVADGRGAGRRSSSARRVRPPPRRSRASGIPQPRRDRRDLPALPRGDRGGAAGRC